MRGNRLVGKCPVCGEALHVQRLHCDRCDTSLEGKFELCQFCRLSREQQEFVEVFLMARGNIKEVERMLGISYPTVRNRLDAVIEALGHPVEQKVASQDERLKVLEALDKGELTPKEAIERLRS